MRRRTLLAGIGPGTATIAGCASTDSDGWGYRTTCELDAFSYRYLPDNAKHEVDTAFSEGSYETEGELYYERLLERPDEQAMRRDDTYYVAEIDRREESSLLGTETVSTLSFTETTPTLEPPRPLTIWNSTDETVDIEVTVRYRTGEVVTDERGAKIAGREVTLEPPDSETASYQVDALDRYTTYEVRLEFETGRTESETVTLDRRRSGIDMIIAADGFSDDGFDESHWPTCPWAPAGLD